ncbi:hypothetical protein ACLI1A_11710 [Flavobacterium sp. RHBU_3]|uniref:hypothetical protein n=1 Tax=Flavobacterium sp. RHBU_3 TaxID=3391184 RepID=UPI003984B35A
MKITMGKKNKTSKKKKGQFKEPERDIADLIDDLAYLNESQNIRKSKSFLDSIYRLND